MSPEKRFSLFSTFAAAIFVTATAARAATFDCLIDPSLSLKIGSPVASILNSVSVDRGDRVRKGQELARLVSGIEAATVEFDRARADSTAEVTMKGIKAAQAEIELSRGRRLQEGTSIAAQKLDELRTNFAVAQQDLALAELNRRLAHLELARAQALLEQRIIRSPIDGVVVQRVLGPGEYVHDTTSIVVIDAIDPLYVEAFLPIAYHGRIAVGDKAMVHPRHPAHPAREATVSIVDLVFDASSATFGVRLKLPNPDAAMPAGLRCDLAFNLPEPPPAAAEAAK